MLHVSWLEHPVLQPCIMIKYTIQVKREDVCMWVQYSSSGD